MEARRTASGKEPLIGIELLRFLSAFAVLVWHYQYFAFTRDGVMIERNQQPFYAVLAPLYEYGGRGVHVFWCISGLIFFFKYFRPVSDGRVSFRTFGLNRFSRLVPLHLITLFAVAVLQGAFIASHGYALAYPFNDLKHFALNLAFISGWGFENGLSFNGPIWSVSIELIAYGAFFLLVSRLPLRWAYAAAAALVATFALCGRSLIAQCLTYFFAGGAIALCRFFPESIPLPAIVRKHAFPLLGAALFAWCAAFVTLKALGVHPSVALKLLRNGLVTSIVYVFVWANSLLAPLASVWAFLGNLTYASYLTHFPIQLLMVLSLPAAGVPIDARSPVLWIAFIGVVIGVAALIYRNVEMPLQTAIRRRYA